MVPFCHPVYVDFELKFKKTLLFLNLHWRSKQTAQMDWSLEIRFTTWDFRQPTLCARRESLKKRFLFCVNTSDSIPDVYRWMSKSLTEIHPNKAKPEIFLRFFFSTYDLFTVYKLCWQKQNGLSSRPVALTDVKHQ